MKILFLTSWYPNKVNPVNGVFIKRHAEAVSLFCEVAVLCVVQNQKAERAYEVEVDDKTGRITSVIVYYRRSKFLLLELIRYIKAGLLGYRVIRDKFGGGPDLIHLNVVIPAGILIFILKLKIRADYIITEHWSGYLTGDKFDRLKGKLWKLISHLVIRKARVVTAVSEALKKAMISHGFRNRYEVIYNVVDIDMFRPPKKFIGGDVKLILHVSTFNERFKNIRGILNAVKAISRKRDDFELHLIGDGKDREMLENYACELGLKDRFVFFHGRRDSRYIAEMMRKANFFVLFSNYETASCVIYEAMASGLPIIATKLEPILEHMSSRFGVLIEPGDENALADAIEYMLDNYAKYDKLLLREYAVKNFSFEIVGRKFKYIYEEILKDK